MSNQTPEGNEDKAQVIPEQVEETIQTEVETEEVVDQPEVETEEVDYKEKFTHSQKEAIRLHKENKKLQENEAYTRKLSKVSKDKDTLQEIHEEDPEVAERISQELFEESYENLFDGGSEEELDVKKLVRTELKADKSKKEREDIEDYEVDFFVNNKITPGSEEYKKIMNTYHEFEPNTLKKAKSLLSMALKSNTTIKEYEEPEAPNTSFSSSAKTVVKENKGSEVGSYMSKEFGIEISPEAMKKAEEAGIV